MADGGGQGDGTRRFDHEGADPELVHEVVSFRRSAAGGGELVAPEVILQR